MPETNPGIWLMERCAIDNAKVDHMVIRDGATGGLDQKRFSHAQIDLWEKAGINEGDRLPMHPFCPQLTLNLPAPERFDLDYFSWNSIQVCSARLRKALAQPAAVVQYIPLTVNTPDPRIKAMDYQIMRVLASQRAIDLGRSETKFTTLPNRYGGEPVICPDGLLERITLLPNLVARTPIFRALETACDLLATDDLAERVMKAGCLGAEFRDPESDPLDHCPTIRTAKGVEVRSPATRRAHLQLVKRMRAFPAGLGV